MRLSRIVTCSADASASTQLAFCVPALSEALLEAGLRYRLVHMWDLTDVAAAEALLAELADPHELVPMRAERLLNVLSDTIASVPASNGALSLTGVFVWATALQAGRGEAGEQARAAAGSGSLELALKVRLLIASMSSSWAEPVAQCREVHTLPLPTRQ